MKLSDFLNGSQPVCVVGLGYVGLPLAVILNRKYAVVGFDIKPRRVTELRNGHDYTGEIDDETLNRCSIEFTDDSGAIGRCSVVIVTVPTPVNAHKIPDLTPVISASRTVGRNMRKGTLIVFESTVYPGVTEDECVPVLEKESGMKHMVDFHVAYSPERVNPGDRDHTVDRITKVVSADDPEMTVFLADLYGQVITAGIHRAPNIKTAEAAKVIENTQRDLNIALMNELSLIFSRMGIDTNEVLDAAATKWNFLRFSPGLVGGHCIGVDPYYLTFKAESLGYRPEVILAGRRINDSMGKFIAEKAVKLLISAGKTVQGSKVLIMGLTFKENISDIRNTRIIDIYKEIAEYGVRGYVWDPHADPGDVREEYGIDLIADPENQSPYDAIILAVKHRELLEMATPDYLRRISHGQLPIIIDVKGIFPRDEMERNGFIHWRL
ncbi:nucleotide sugar dehydrogenase [bacterium]|nr:nucleotide sugar dehydrogenase [candidate division CSSED10-310 bacterium]